MLCEPFLASVGQAKPTQYLQAMQASRPPYGRVLISNGTGLVIQPSCCAPRFSADGLRTRRNRQATDNRDGGEPDL